MARPSACAARVARAVPAVALALLVATVALPQFAGTAGALHGAAAFEDTIHSQQRGDVVRFDVHFADAEPPHPRRHEYNATTANVSIRGHGYEAVVEVHDDDGDGEVGFRFNTFAAGRGRPNETFAVATPGDRVTVRRASATGGLLPAGEYDTTLAVGNLSREESAVGLLFLEERGLRNLTVLRGPPGLSDALETPGDVTTARRDGRLVRAYAVDDVPGSAGPGVPVVGRGELLGFELRATGLEGALAAADGTTPTDRFESLLGSELSLQLRQIPPPERDGHQFRFGGFAERRVVPDPRNDTYYLFVDPSAPVTPTDGASVVDLDRIDAGVYAAEVTVPDGSRLATAGSEVATAEVTFVDRRAWFATDRDPLLAGSGRVTVPLRTTLPPGTTIDVHVEHATGPYYPLEGRVTVGADGRAAATFDLSGVGPGEAFDVVVERAARVHRLDGRIAAAAVEFRDRSVDADAVSSVTVDSVRTTAGAFVALRRGDVGGPFVGTSGYLPPGDHTDVGVPVEGGLDADATLVAVVHWDVDGDAEFDADDRRFGASVPSHRTGGTTVADAASVTLLADATTAAPTRTDAPTPTDPTGSPADDSSTSPTEIPGLGALVALVALLVVVLRRV